MDWAHLKLWAEGEEKTIHKCIIEALTRLVNSKAVKSEDEEIVVSGKLRPLLYRVKKKQKLIWILQPEASSFGEGEMPKPIGHPDFRFSANTPTFDQYEYDIECKLVRIKRKGKSMNYCEHYVTEGIQRFQTCKYAQSLPPMGTIIGYVQEGNIVGLMKEINMKSKALCSSEMKLKGNIFEGGVTQMLQELARIKDSIKLFHIWADLR